MYAIPSAENKTIGVSPRLMQDIRKARNQQKLYSDSSATLLNPYVTNLDVKGGNDQITLRQFSTNIRSAENLNHKLFLSATYNRRGTGVYFSVPKIHLEEAQAAIAGLHIIAEESQGGRILNWFDNTAWTLNPDLEWDSDEGRVTSKTNTLDDMIMNGPLMDIMIGAEHNNNILVTNPDGHTLPRDDGADEAAGTVNSDDDTRSSMLTESDTYSAQEFKQFMENWKRDKSWPIMLLMEDGMLYGDNLLDDLRSVKSFFSTFGMKRIDEESMEIEEDNADNPNLPQLSNNHLQVTPDNKNSGVTKT